MMAVYGGVSQGGEVVWRQAQQRQVSGGVKEVLILPCKWQGAQ